MRDRTSAGAEFFASSALAQSEARTIPQGSGNCEKNKKKKRLQHLSFAYGHPLHYSVRLSQA